MGDGGGRPVVGLVALDLRSIRVASVLDGFLTVTFTGALLALLVAGWVTTGRTDRRGPGALMLATAILAAASAALGGLDWGPWPFLSGLLYPLAGISLAHLLLRWPDDRLQTPAHVWFIRSAWVAVPGLQLADYLAWDPAWGGYTGPAWWPRLLQDRSVEAVLDGVSNGVQLVALVVFLVLVTARLLRAGRQERFELASTAVAAGAFAVANLLGQGLTLVGADLGDPGRLLENIAFGAVPVAFLVSTAVRRVLRALAVESLLQPRQLATATSTRTALARALDDPLLTIVFWSPTYEDYLTPEGGPAPVEDPTRHQIQIRSSDDRPLARISAHPRLAARSDVVEAVTRAAAIPLENARLQAELHAAQLGARRASDRLGEARETTRQLSRLLPGGLADRIGADPDALTRTERLTVTVLMSDVRGYSAIAEQTDPGRLAEQLNAHRRAMNEAVLAHGGTVMQYVGDAVMAVFGAPEELVGHQTRALAAAAAMHEAQRLLDRRWAEDGLPAFGLGIGLSTGPVAAGFLGSPERIEYTIVGDTVNLAARLCDLARPAGVTVASAATTISGPDGAGGEPMPPLLVKGRATSVSAYRIPPATTPLSAVAS